MSLTLLPDLGDLLRLYPQYNAGTVVELVRSLGAREVLWASSADPDHPLRDALPAAGLAIREGFTEDWAWAEAEYDQFLDFLKLYPQGRERLREAGRAEGEFAALLGTPAAPDRLLGPEVLDAAARYHETQRRVLDEGPGTVWRDRRLTRLAGRLSGHTGVVIAPLDDLPELLARLPGAALPDLSAFTPGETSRLRALADRAWQLREEDDLTALLEALERETGDRVTPEAELQATAASIHLAVGDLQAARELLERAAHSLQGELPRSLAGLVLARLGQVRDALGDRDLAVRTYRAVLALSHAPQIARDTAEAGLKEAFALQLSGGADQA
ncbi:tetratricopeptide repeat protein [Deinococcus koreensis]|uniref:Tetratricopeptide repeat protein n=1 Tax=Deinococcus koreensis TaxID=2054903 RepID=A0A2K3UUZ7_9DEIO|nr:tetratricopeptide repeat protein [Deinococcus koreensis]PNY80356.1 hypothetical protein CVO96_02335 [Deinococcus koreensis]